MYNARSYFKSAQSKALSANGRPTPQAVDEYTKAIKKCGIILADGGKSPRAHDALFLMARALFYKGNSAFQAKDAFENLIKGYPNSPHIPDAYIYRAKVLREINLSQEAESSLEVFIRDPRFIKHHSRALLVLADFEIKDKDYYRAQYWLEKIISDYPKTKEFKEAFFLFGKNYYMQQNYAQSQAEFEKFIKTRGIDKQMKQEAQYYVALNQYEQGNYASALKSVKHLTKNETRPDKLSQARVLYARSLLATGHEAEGLSELEAVTKAYPRTEQSAAAFFFWGEYLYYKKGDIAKAVPNLNRVRTEFSASQYATIGSQKATALNLLTPKTLLNSETNLQAFLDHHYQRAESFLSALSLPDSSLEVYRRVISERSYLRSVSDSLATLIANTQAQIDSLNTALESSTTNIKTESVEINSDPSKEEDTEILENSAQSDSTKTESVVDPSIRIKSLSSSIKPLQNRIEVINASILRFDTEITPFCYFAMISILEKDHNRKAESDLAYQALITEFPKNKYTTAAASIRAGKIPELIDPEQEAIKVDFERILGYSPAQPDSLIAGLLRYTDSEYLDIAVRANFRLGWHFTYEAMQPYKAKPYLNMVLSESASSEYGILIKRFYDGTDFLYFDAEEPPDETDQHSIVSDSLYAKPELFYSYPTLPVDLDKGFDFNILRSDSTKVVPDTLTNGSNDPAETNSVPIELSEDPKDIDRNPNPAIKEEDILSE